MTDIRPIETVYRGYRFRSRLEARWAVFFDSLRLHWRYEDEGYEFDGHRYLPDFVLPELDAIVEIKPLTSELREVWDRYSKDDDAFWDGAKKAGLPFATLVGLQKASAKAILLVVGVPGEGFVISLGLPPQEGNVIGLAWESFAECASCRRLGLLCLIRRADNERFLAIETPRRCVNGCEDEWITEHVEQAVYEARSARFEHGQVGAPSEWDQH